MATKAPRLRSVRTRPSKESICSAARATVRLTSNKVPTSPSDSLVPGASRRSTIASRNWSRIAWARSSLALSTAGKVWSAIFMMMVPAPFYPESGRLQRAKVNTIPEKIAYDFCDDRWRSPIICAFAGMPFRRAAGAILIFPRNPLFESDAGQLACMMLCLS
ncbi:hypothetical protein MES5069_30023 [Mesorhizobium escarrei]|uniref:Uncharacterized protein n=1 Tax=Mesorhizobium escarrei TaxID=666018 RepID=A0ABN8JVM7_9HYPH|nr:hypothetical protein MES5069_30023 [Mesorhizobium escarrei]